MPTNIQGMHSILYLWNCLNCCSSVSFALLLCNKQVRLERQTATVPDEGSQSLLWDQLRPWTPGGERCCRVMEALSLEQALSGGTQSCDVVGVHTGVLLTVVSQP